MARKNKDCEHTFMNAKANDKCIHCGMAYAKFVSITKGAVESDEMKEEKEKKVIAKKKKEEQVQIQKDLENDLEDDDEFTLGGGK